MTALIQAQARVAMPSTKRKKPLALLFSKLAGLLRASARMEDEPSVRPFPFFGE